MNFRRDLPFIIISLCSFQEFDHGKNIEQTLPSAFALEIGDRFEWECGQFYGVAEIIEQHDDVYTIKKIS